jgi:hypothetical protein
MFRRAGRVALVSTVLAGPLSGQGPITSWRAAGGPVWLQLETILTGGQIHEVDAAGHSTRVLVAEPYSFVPVFLGDYTPGAWVRFGAFVAGVWEYQGAPVAARSTWPAGGFRIDYWVESRAAGTATLFGLTGVDAYADPATGTDAGPNVTDASVVPEPATWALLGTGLIALGGGVRRRRHVDSSRPAARVSIPH